MRTYRTLEREEIPLVRELVEGLDPDDQYRHFLQDMSEDDFDAWEERARHHTVLGCFSGDELVGFAEIAGADDRVECSLCIGSEHRRKGIGTALFERACVMAHEAGAHRLSIFVTRGDVEMFDLAARHKGYATYSHGRSMILSSRDHTMACWLSFNLDSMPPAEWFAGAVRWVRDLLEV